MTYVCADLQGSVACRWVLQQELVNHPIELHEAVVLPEVVLKTNAEKRR